MPVNKIQVGQVWKKNDTGQNYLVTKVFTEALATFAVLRKAGAEEEDRLRVKVERAGATETLPGFVYAQEAEHF
jgi:RimJ/RimL family protein N-acetyltransferase